MKLEGCLLGFDYGTARIGVAVGQRLTGTASAVAVVKCRDGAPDWDAISRLIQEWQPSCLVVGLPLTEDGGEQPISERARRFARQLEGRYRMPVALCDERNSSNEAARRFAFQRAAGAVRRKQGEQIDALAACVILENHIARTTD